MMESAEILETLGQKYCVAILEATHKPMSAQELSDELGIPIATCYRRIEELTDKDLLVLHDKRLTDEGRRTNVYRRQIEALTIEFTDSARVTVERNEGLTTKLDAAWQKLSGTWTSPNTQK